MQFQGGEELFSNVYTFDTGVAESFDDLPIINRLVQLEKLVHGTRVRFDAARSYGIAGPGITNVMREVIDLTGTGAIAGDPCYGELAVLVQFALPRSTILRRKRVGRKWLRVGNFPTSISANSGPGTAISPLGSTAVNFYLDTYARPLVNEDWSGGAEFASNGDPFTAPTIFPFLDHRQFHA